MKLIRFIRSLKSFDARQCDERHDDYYEREIQDTPDEASEAATTASNQGVIIEYRRANQAKIGQMLRARYGEIAREELPRDLLEALYDLEQRLQRRGGE